MHVLQATNACAGSTCYDVAIECKIPSLVRRFEAAAKLGAFVCMKVPGLLGFGSDFREFWVVLFQRVPNPSVPAHRRVSHSQLYIFASYSDAVPVSKVWTDGAQVATLNNAPNSNSASAILVCSFFSLSLSSSVRITSL